MPYSDPEKDRLYKKEYHKKYSVEYNKRPYVKVRRREIDSRIKKEKRDWVSSLKAEKPCADCGLVFPPICMDFDHRNPEEKLFSISKSVQSKKKIDILAEIEKCDLVCANCHRLRHSS